MTQAPEPVLTAAEVATQLGVPVATVRQWLWDGQLRGQRRGGMTAGWRIRAADLARFVAEHSQLVAAARSPNQPQPR
jgi:excisionase family DNA binding protein